MQTTQGADKGSRPVALAVEPGGIPAELKQLKRWVLWRYEWNQEKGKWDKPPLGPLKGHRTSVQRPGGWGTFNVALAGLRSNRGKAVGIGFVLSSGPDDPLDIAGIDIDDPALIPLLAPLATYTEETPTAGKGGARALLRGKLPQGHTCRAAGGGAEAYDSGRYFTVTGRRLDGSPAGLARPDPGTLAAVLRSLGLLGAHLPPAPPPPVGAVGGVGGQTSRRATPCRVTLEPQSPDDLLLQTAYRARNGAEIRRLMDGDITEYADHSRADIALVNHLEFYFRTEEAIDRVFRTSGLMRPKWDEVHYATGETYGQHTIRDAMKTGGAHYGDRRRTANGEAVPGKAPTTPTAPTAPTGGGGAGAGAGAPPSANGHAPPPGALPGRLASDVTEEAVEWFLRPWFVRGMLTLLVGEMNTGKSTLLAKLASLARRVVYLPGPEEHVPAMTLHRLRAAGVELRNVRLLDDRRYSLFDDRALLTRVLAGDGADLMVVDPVDSFFPDGWSDLNNTQTRDVLEALENVARDTKAAVVGVRHPGKVPGNVMRGAVAWGAVPRSVVELIKDAGPPVQRIIHPYKWGFPGSRPADQYFSIEGEGGRHGVFVLGAPVSPSMVEMLAATPDQLMRTQIELACDLVKRMLAEGEQEVGWMLNLGRTQGYSEPTMQRAKRLMGVTTRHDGQGRGSKHFWVPPAEWPG